MVEDSGTHTVAQFASVLSTGPSDETGQTVTYLVTTDNEALFSEAPAVAPDGTLTYTLAANANGVAHVSVQVRDSGGTANGGIDTSGVQSFTITVTPVNDAPTFTLGANQTVVEDSGTHTVAQFASILSTGPSDETGQTVTYLVTTDNETLFSEAPALAPDGTLTYTLAANANGVAHVSVQVRDSGGQQMRHRH